ncbi:MAG: type IV pilus twitching motility protein PilT [Candidatus Pacebacteria bacterium]|nr:type IV pilus twitching motility protein PilT [Candidatus Paceibacterota bacterium]PIR64256.1 MAG: type IV pili twitching motility protein PilT [Candidatus Pacebacteria bacterium CG10_big_fil_rev_8_21_14_0_10_40_26]PIZ79078.1 MAG: type IV pili twitching motility protein PilT [Candidatus Pacebacteria bacterium CG_4_10_14_0_2_um_filter_40_20]PJA69234.1 MAG: type IV pili twitching motility protein PilT [Candidatus Pacebacteria bacterium CG_4_9_14_3_um_filter_40_12]PJC42044.1 MAG: type IV pili t
MNIHDIMQSLVEQEGSDIHIAVGTPPTIRVDGVLSPVPNAPILGAAECEALIHPILTQEQKDYVGVNKELDFGYQFKEYGRFRVNVYHSKNAMAAALRLIPSKVKSLEDLHLPEIFKDFTMFKQGLVLITGPTGEGKSTSLAAMIDRINQTRAEHILTIEDPIEFMYTPAKSVISQREINQDTHGWDIALKSVLREDPDVVLIGEMRDYETIASAITIAETGHLVFATLHTASAAQTIDRIIDVFPAHQQGQIRQQLAATLKVVASQRLLPKTSGGRVAALEIMVANPAIRNLIREAKTHQIDTVMQTSAGDGMMLIETHLQQLVQQGAITLASAREYAFRKEDLDRLLGSAK